MRNRIFVAILTVIIACPALRAQSLWTSVEMNKKLGKGLNAFVEGEYRTHDGFASTERWSGTIGLDYKALPFLKLTGGYTYIHQRTEQEVTKKGNIIPPYWQPKHRAFFAMTGNYEWKRFTFALRERYQYTYRTEQYVSKFDEDGVTPKDDEWVESKGKHVLRSRLEVEYNIKKSRFKPFASYEIYNSLSDGFAVDKARYTIGADYKFNRTHSVNLFYRYIDKADDDEASGHIIGIGYKFKL